MNDATPTDYHQRIKKSLFPLLQRFGEYCLQGAPLEKSEMDSIHPTIEAITSLIDQACRERAIEELEQFERYLWGNIEGGKVTSSPKPLKYMRDRIVQLKGETR